MWNFDDILHEAKHSSIVYLGNYKHNADISIFLLRDRCGWQTKEYFTVDLKLCSDNVTHTFRFNEDRFTIEETSVQSNGLYVTDIFDPQHSTEGHVRFHRVDLKHIIETLAQEMRYIYAPRLKKALE